MKTLITTLSMVMVIVLLAGCGAGGNPPGTNNSNTPATPISVAVSPTFVQVTLGGTRQFTATTTGGTGVTWTIQTGGAAYGTIDTSGLYTAPSLMPGSTSVTIRATAQADPTIFSQATVSLQPGTTFGGFPVRFDVTSRNGWQSLQAPVTVGIPLPPGMHTDVNTLGLEQQAGGVSVPAQFRVTSRWPTGHIRWVLVDFIADLSAATGIGEYQLDTGGSGSATGTSLSVVNGATDIQVSTGMLNFTLSKTGFRLFESVEIDRDSDSQVDDECLNTAAIEGIVVTEGVNDFLMDQSAPSRIEVEETGPIRTTVVVEGRHEDTLSNTKLNYVVRITAWNDLPFIKVQYSFKNMDGDGAAAATNDTAAQQLRSVQVADAINLNLPIDFQGANPIARIGGQPGTHSTTSMTTADNVELQQGYSGTYDAPDTENPQPPAYNVGTGEGSSAELTNIWPTQDESNIDYTVTGVATGSGGRAPGWMQAYGSSLQVTVAVREFWELYPKTLRAQGDGLLQVGIWPSSAWQLQVFAGAMKTHEVLLSFDRAGGLSTAGAEARAHIINDPPRGVCDPRHYAASRAFGDIAWTDQLLQGVNAFRTTSQTFAANYMQEVTDHMGDISADRNGGNGTATGHEYGMWSFGDGKHSSPVNGWENNNWGFSRACFQWYAMSGSLPLFYLGDISARHFRDVDVLHSDIGTRFAYTEAGNPAVSGGLASQLGKTRFFTNNKQHDLGAYRDFGDAGLDMLKGAFLAEHYLLTGDRLSLDVLQEVFTYLRGTWKRFFDAGNGGVDSTMTAPTTWLSNALMIAAAYEMANGDNDPDAGTMLTYVTNVVNTRQRTATTNDPMANGFADNSGFFRAWEVGHLMEALEHTRWVTNDAAWDISILDGMNWLLGTNANVYLGNLTPPQVGEFAEQTNGLTDFGGANLMIGAGYVGAYRASTGAAQSNWQALADNLINTQTQNILDTTIGDDEIRHGSFARFFRGGPMLLATVKQ